MAESKDIKLTDDDDIYIDAATGDLVVAASDQQHVKDLIEYGPGHLKEYPLVGVDIIDYIGASGKYQELKRRIRLNMEADGYRVDDNFVSETAQIYVSGGKL